MEYKGNKDKKQESNTESSIVIYAFINGTYLLLVRKNREVPRCLFTSRASTVCTFKVCCISL